MAYYDTYVRSNNPPYERWKDRLQAFVDKQFINASTFYDDVEEEIAFGTLEFRPIYVRVTTLVDAKTGQRINEDYKKLIFPDLSHRPRIGTRYRFEDNIWICFSTDNTKTDTSSVYVRRCNNTMNTQDKYGNIHEEPCYIDYKVTENQIYRDYSIDVPSGRIQVWCQYNKWTQSLQINDRFMFGREVYKVRERSGFDRRSTFDPETLRMVSFYADYDNLASDDNQELEVANYKVYNYSIQTDEKIENGVGFENKLITTVYLDDDVVEEEVDWSSSDTDVAEITEDGSYTLLSPGECTFTGIMKNKPDVAVVVSVVVVKTHGYSGENYTTVLRPTTDYIRLNQTETYSVYEYKDNVVTDTDFKIECLEVPQKNYRLESNGNTFSITNLKQYTYSPMTVKYTNLRTLESGYFYVELGGIT